MNPEPLDYARPDPPRRPWWDAGLLSFAVAVATVGLVALAWSAAATGRSPLPFAVLLVPINPITGVTLGIVGIRAARGGDSGAAGPGLILNGLLSIPLACSACFLLANLVLG